MKDKFLASYPHLMPEGYMGKTVIILGEDSESNADCTFDSQVEVNIKD
jgi:hypothetical protein